MDGAALSLSVIPRPRRNLLGLGMTGILEGTLSSVKLKLGT